MKSAQPKVKRILIIVSIVLAAVAIVLLGAYAAVHFFLRSADSAGEDAGSGNRGEHSVIVNAADSIFAEKSVVNILLLGRESVSDEEEEPQCTDAMILCTINIKEKTITLTSFLSDLWVYIPDLYNQRINVPYKLGGTSLLNETLEYNFGIRADYNVEIDFSGFVKAIDIVGGLEIELTAVEAKYMNEHGNFSLEYDKNWQLHEGVNKLTGEQALAYTRISQLGTDFARVGRHQTVLEALVMKMETISSADMFDLSRELLPLLSTDMTESQVLELFLELLSLREDLCVKEQHIPMNGQYTYEKKGKGDVLVMNKEQLEMCKKLLEDTVREK